MTRKALAVSDRPRKRPPSHDVFGAIVIDWSFDSGRPRKWPPPHDGRAAGSR